MKNFKERMRGVLKSFREIIKKPEMAILPGHLAFFFFLAVMPILTLISYIAAFFNLSLKSLTDFIGQAFSPSIAELLTPSGIPAEINFGFIVLILVGFYIASNGCKSIIVTSNTIYGIKDDNLVKIRIKSIIMSLIIVVLFIFILVVPVFGDKLIELIKYADIDSRIVSNIETVFNLFKGPVSWAIMFIFIKIIYTMAPNKKVESANVNVGTLWTTITWVIVTAIYSYYTTNFARYDLLYAGLSNLVILILWVYFLAYLFVIGMALNYRKEEKMAKTGIIKQIKE